MILGFLWITDEDFVLRLRTESHESNQILEGPSWLSIMEHPMPTVTRIDSVQNCHG